MAHHHNYKPNKTGLKCSCGSTLTLREAAMKLNLVEKFIKDGEPEINDVFDLICEYLKKAYYDDGDDLYIDGDRK